MAIQSRDSTKKQVTESAYLLMVNLVLHHQQASTQKCGLTAMQANAPRLDIDY